jgi:hypothetical protein
MESPGQNLRRLHVLICVVGLGLYVPGFVQQARQPTLPPDLPRETLAYPVHLGGLEAANAEQLRFLGEGWPVGTRLELRQADGHTRQVELVARRDRTYLTVAAFGAIPSGSRFPTGSPSRSGESTSAAAVPGRGAFSDTSTSSASPRSR